MKGVYNLVMPGDACQSLKLHHPLELQKKKKKKPAAAHRRDENSASPRWLKPNTTFYSTRGVILICFD